MKWFDNAVSAAKGSLEVSAKDIMAGFIGVEKQKRGSFTAQQAEQTAARHTPQVDSQNRGAPVAIKPQVTPKKLVGEVSKDETVVDKKLLYVGGGLLALVAVVVVVSATK